MRTPNQVIFGIYPVDALASWIYHQVLRDQRDIQVIR